MQNIWFTGDTHYHHKNIVKGVTEWKISDNDGGVIHTTRNFDTLDEHDDVLINNINDLVKENDILYHLGDWSFGGAEQIQVFRNVLNCKNIHLIFGNHDQHIEPLGSPYRGCFSSVQYVKQFTLKLGTEVKGRRMEKQGFFLSHYSHQIWNQSHHGAIHLFGHSHGSLPGIGKSMDVGVDTNDLYPYHLDEILEIMKNIPIGITDHHNSKTN